MVDPSVYPFYERLNQNPEDAEALLVLWQWHGDRGEFQQLATLAEQVASRRTDPSSAADLFFRAGELWAKNVGRHDKAVGNYRRAYELDPQQIQAIEAARAIYLQLGNHKLAVQLFERQLSATADPQVRLPLLRDFAALRGQLGDPSGQAAALEEAIRIVPDDFEAMRELAAAYLARAEAPGGTDSDRMRAASLLGTIAQGLGGEHTVAFAEAALDAWPGDEAAFSLVRDAYLSAGRGDELALRQVHFVTANPTSEIAGQVRRELADLYLSAGQLDDAISALEPIAADPGVTDTLIELYRRVGRSADLLALLRSLPASGDPTQRVAELREIAELSGQQGDREAMVGAMREILSLDPGDAEALALVEDDLRNRKAFAELRDVLYAAARAQDIPPEVRFARFKEIATISEQRLNDIDGAIDAWRAAIEVDPQQRESSRTLDALLVRSERWDDLAAFLADRAQDGTEAEQRGTLERLVEIHRDRRQDPSGEAAALGALWQLTPTDDAIAVRLIDARRRAGDSAGVTEVMRARAEAATGPDAIARYIELGEHLEASGERDLALDAWQQVATIDPALLKPWEAIERILERTGRLDLLIETLIAHASGPAAGERAAPLHARAADIARALGDLATARDQATIALGLTPDDESLATLLMDTFEALGERERLVGLLRDRSARAPDGDVKIALLRRAAHTVGQTDPVAAAEIWNDLRDVAKRANKGDDGEALEALAGFAELAGDIPKLAELLAESAKFTADPAARLPLLTRRAEILATDLQRPDDAIATLRQIVDDIDPKHEPTWARIGDLATAAEQHALAAETLEKRLPLTEDDEWRAALASRLADLCEQQLKDIPRTLTALEAWYDADPTDYTVVTRLATLYEQEAKWPEVIKYLEVLAEVEGDEDDLSTMVRRIADIAENNAANPRKAFDVLKPTALTGDAPALDALRAVAERAKLEADLIPVLAELANKSKAPETKAAYWREVAQRAEKGLGDPRQALDAWHKVLAAQATDHAALDEIDRLAGEHRDGESLARAYAVAVPAASSADEVRELTLRGIARLESAGALGLAFDLALAAQNRAPGEDALLDAVIRIAPQVRRGDEMFVAFDRRRKVAKDEAERYALMLRAAESAIVGLGDRETGFNYLRLATQQATAGKQPDESRIDMIVALARRVDADQPETNLRTGVVEMFAQLAEDVAEDNPRVASLLNRHAGRVCLEDLSLAEHAWQLFERAITLWSADTASAELLEKVATPLGRGAQVVDLYQKVIDDAYDAHTARTYQARRAALLADVLGRVDDALEALRHLVEIAPKDLEAIHAWQSLLRRHGRYQDLLMALERELQAGGPDPLAVRKEIATVWEQRLRNAFEARDAWKKVQKLAPDDPDVRAAFERLDKRRVSVDLEDDFPSDRADAVDELSASEISAPPSEPIDELSASAIVSPPAESIDKLSSSEFSAAAEPVENLTSSEFGAAGESDEISPIDGDGSSQDEIEPPHPADVTREIGEVPPADLAPARRLDAPSAGSIQEFTAELTNPDLPTMAFSAPAPSRELREPVDEFANETTANVSGAARRAALAEIQAAESEPSAASDSTEAYAADEPSSEHLLAGDLEAVEEADAMDAEPLDDEEELEADVLEEPADDLESLAQLAVAPRTSMPPPPPPRTSMPPPPPPGASRPPPPPRKI